MEETNTYNASAEIIEQHEKDIKRLANIILHTVRYDLLTAEHTEFKEIPNGLLIALCNNLSILYPALLGYLTIVE